MEQVSGYYGGLERPKESGLLLRYKTSKVWVHFRSAMCNSAGVLTAA